MLNIKRGLFLKPLPSGPYATYLNPDVIDMGGDQPREMVFRGERFVAGTRISDILRAQIMDGTLEFNESLKDGVWQLNGNLKVYDGPFIKPATEDDKQGVEDPRLTCFEGKYNLLHTQWNGKVAKIGHYSGESLNTLVNHGTISPKISNSQIMEWVTGTGYEEHMRHQVKNNGGDSIFYDKDGALFPERINGKIVLIHRPDPNIVIAPADSFKDYKKPEYWEYHFKHIDEYVFIPAGKFQKKGIGGSPFKIPKDLAIPGFPWLIPYHAVKKPENGGDYIAKVALASYDLKHVIELEESLLEPQEPWEQKGNGQRDGVVFIGKFLRNRVNPSLLDAYYGGADSVIGLAQISSLEILLAMFKPMIKELAMTNTMMSSSSMGSLTPSYYS